MSMILKWCSGCKDQQAEFTSASQRYCKKCRNSRAKKKYRDDPTYKQAQSKRAKQRYINIGRLHIYGLGKEQFLQMLEEQNNRCKICLKLFSEKGYDVPRIDHCHATGKNRGLLCNNCNRGLGFFLDSAELMERAAHYISEYDLTGK